VPAGVAAVILELHFTAMANYYNAIFYGIVLASSLGSFLVLAVLAVSYRLRDTMAILIVGLMFGSLTSAIVEHSLISVLSNYKNLPSGPWESGNLSWTSIGFYSFAY
jgi:iron complex transport system permease protein